MIYENFVGFMRSAVVPRKSERPEDIRLDGQTSGSSRNVFGRFRHGGRVWEVHEDTRYEPLFAALSVAERGSDPFLEEPTQTGKRLCLTVKEDIWRRQRSKYHYIYSTLKQ